MLRTKRSTRAPASTPGVQMQPPETATIVRVQDGKTRTTDGPLVEINESIGGYFFLATDDFAAAIETTSRVPTAFLGRRRSASTGAITTPCW